MAALPSNLPCIPEGCKPQMSVSQSSQPYPALPHIPQPQLKVREKSKLCVVDLQKYSPSFWSFAKGMEQR